MIKVNDIKWVTTHHYSHYEYISYSESRKIPSEPKHEFSITNGRYKNYTINIMRDNLPDSKYFGRYGHAIYYHGRVIRDFDLDTILCETLHECRLNATKHLNKILDGER